MAAQSKAWNVFIRWNTGIIGSNPIQVMDVCVYSVLELGSGLERAHPPPRSPTDCLRLGNWSETKRFTDALCSKWEQQKEEEE
jgi:hypothetical protein